MGLFDLFSNKAADRAAEIANSYAELGYNRLVGDYQTGRDALQKGTDTAAGIYSDLSGMYKGGADAYGDVSGAHGVEGLQRGTDLFKNSGQYGVYGFANDQAQQALQRAHAAGGNLVSGNTDYDAMKAASGLAGNYWGQFQQGLAPYLQNYGTSEAKRAELYPTLANALNQSWQGQGAAANTEANTVGRNAAGAELNNYQVGANQLNAIMGAVKLAMAVPTGGASLFGGFGGGAPTQQQNFWNAGNTGPV